ncbi:DUF5028 domain-containing protein [Collinsella sp. AGMB00827]|uniref:DUF5028 domain-containing protein n=1 Tax=Collinsella ureilytica TaxID=2869515 RepID=A0ABS7MKJ6_9ACTN|nr:DUF5028 domain-containing protein [Collinsella urealyticum]MBY4797894.1 DUF5028 domain-containing protein [Collinsella urealyticum]
MRRKMLAAALLTFTVAAIAFRIWVVNQNQLSIPAEHYGMREWVELDGAFLFDYQEQTDGYAIKVTNASVMTAEEYVRAYAGESDVVPQDPTGDVIVLDLSIRNQGNSEGFIDILSQWLLGQRKDRTYQYDYDLWELAEPSMRDESGFKLVENSVYETHVPFVNATAPRYLESVSAWRRKPADDAYVDLVISNAPVRKMIRIPLKQM